MCWENPSLCLENSCSSCIKRPQRDSISATFILCLRTTALLWLELYLKQAQYISKVTAMLFFFFFHCYFCVCVFCFVQLLQIVTGICNNPVQYGCFKVICFHSFLQTSYFHLVASGSDQKKWLIVNLNWFFYIKWNLCLIHKHISCNSYYSGLFFIVCLYWYIRPGHIHWFEQLYCDVCLMNWVNNEVVIIKKGFGLLLNRYYCYQ